MVRLFASRENVTIESGDSIENFKIIIRPVQNVTLFSEAIGRTTPRISVARFSRSSIAAIVISDLPILYLPQKIPANRRRMGIVIRIIVSFVQTWITTDVWLMQNFSLAPCIIFLRQLGIGHFYFNLPLPSQPGVINNSIFLYVDFLFLSEKLFGFSVTLLFGWSDSKIKMGDFC